VRTVALLGRVPGFLVLRDALLGNPLVSLAAVYTHGRRPRAEGGGERPELARFIDACAAAGVPLHVLDMPEARGLERYLPAEPFDLLLSLSWRCVLPRIVLDRPQLAAINLHRGALPDYAGAEPVRRAIEKGERRIAITAHRMVEEVDAGEILDTTWYDIDPLPPGMAAAQYAEAVKEKLFPFYAPLARRVIAAIAGGER